MKPAEYEELKQKYKDKHDKLMHISYVAIMDKTVEEWSSIETDQVLFKNFKDSYFQWLEHRYNTEIKVLNLSDNDIWNYLYPLFLDKVMVNRKKDNYINELDLVRLMHSHHVLAIRWPNVFNIATLIPNASFNDITRVFELSHAKNAHMLVDDDLPAVFQDYDKRKDLEPSKGGFGIENSISKHLVCLKNFCFDYYLIDSYEKKHNKK
jgi:hypothetical protein